MTKSGKYSIDFFEEPDLPGVKKGFNKGIKKLEDELGWKFGYGEKKTDYIVRQFRRFWKFIKTDSWASLIVSLILAFLIIKFIFFPLLSLATGAELPLVIVESCSMYHANGMKWVFQSSVYEDYNLSLDNAKNWGFTNGLNKGDIIFVVGTKAEDLKIGDIIIFEAGQMHPIIHRVISINDDGTVTTKGDNFKTNSGLLDAEKSIKPEQIIGKAVFKIPLLGWVKLIFFEWAKSADEKGLCH